MIKLENSWNEILKDEFNKDYYKKLENFLNEEYSLKTIYPKKDDIFSSLNTTDYKDVKVLLLGQDPYHGENQAHGMAFSVKEGVPLPPSLKNIYKEITNDIGCEMSNSGYLLPWSKQGVLLLNTVLTVQQGSANSHKNKGWETFTDEIINKLNERKEPVIFMLWGNNAKHKTKLITNPQHYILIAPHPSPLSAYHGFFGCKHFSKVNEILISNGEKPIEWKI